MAPKPSDKSLSTALKSSTWKKLAEIFVGNTGSRRAFEKNGFLLEGTIRKCTKKNGILIDEWLFGIIKDDFKP